MKHQTKIYTLGFVFDEYRRVLLIRKTRPEWQCGRWNGVGGAVDGEETLEQCISRECEEETGMQIPDSSWRSFAKLHSPSWMVMVYLAEWSREHGEASSKTDEIVKWYSVSNLPNTINNVPWLLDIALDYLRESGPSHVSAYYQD
jgi:ADP-ribose pyrophosphatase YjhB (NUDIX family)